MVVLQMLGADHDNDDKSLHAAKCNILHATTFHGCLNRLCSLKAGVCSTWNIIQCSSLRGFGYKMRPCEHNSPKWQGHVWLQFLCQDCNIGPRADRFPERTSDKAMLSLGWNVGDRYGWTTGVRDNGHDWRKFRVVPRSYPLRPPCVPLLSTLFNRGGNRRAFRLPGEGGDHFHCLVEPSPGHIRCRECCDFYYVPKNWSTQPGLHPNHTQMEMRTRYGDADEMQITTQARFGGQSPLFSRFGA